MSHAKIEAATQEWSYDQMKVNYGRPHSLAATDEDRNRWVEVSESFYQQALEVLPPIYVAGGFMVSEPECHEFDGRPVYAGFVHIDGRHFGCYATVRDFKTETAILRATLSKVPA